MKKYDLIIFLTVLTFGILICSNVFATEVLKISNYTSVWANSWYCSREYSFQSFIPISNFSLSKIGVNFGYVSCSGTTYFDLRNAQNDILASSSLVSCENMSANIFTYYTFSIPYPLIASTTYYLTADGNPIDTLPLYSSRSQGSSYADGCAGGANLSDFPNCAAYGETNDLAFEIYGIGVPTIAIEYPGNETIIPDFLNFTLSFTTPNYVDTAQLKMCYGTNQSAIGDCPNSTLIWPNLIIDYQNYYHPATSSQSILISFTKTQALASSTIYYGKAYLYDFYMGTFLASSPEMSWTIASSSVPAPESVSSTLGIAGDWAGLLNLIKMKPPVGYFYSGINAWGGLNASGTPAVSLPSYGPIQDYIFTPIRTGLIFILWLIFGVWIWHRFRHIEL